MRRDKNIFFAAVAALMILPVSLLAQSYGSINTYSPYSMYGLGELHTQGSLTSRSMGGVGVAMRTGSEINVLNPASYSSTYRRSVLFNFGAEGSNNFNTQTLDGDKLVNSYAAFNIHDIALQFPIASNMGAALTIAPYSSVGYKISTSEDYTDIGRLSYVYEGGGDITQINLGWGWEPFKNFSVGVAAQYYWGVIARSFIMSPYVITGYGNYYSTSGETSYTFSKVMFQAGLQWTPIMDQKRILTFGATYDLGGNLSPDYEHYVGSETTFYTITASSITEELDYILPSQIAAGFMYQNPKWTVGLDYVYQDWYSSNSGIDNTINTSSGVEVAYNDFSTIKLGAQYIPNRNDVRRYFRRVSYRGGLRYGGYQTTFGGHELTQYAITLGAGFPLKVNGVSKVDVGLEYGSLGSNKLSVEADSTVGLIRQDYVKLSLSFSLFGDDYWFQRPKYD